ncbi:Hypothetical predicted protein [Olea europaea subsp. europaea]|uniref:Uncharacterized protein n=1 Tax=Olea europaea subsp. europaea TaxID=158383 RepID=A0A8S0QG42_OLEEU|nr:Hypothetical predicted protein [Olea europaea subsp. europaea]
MDNKNQRTEKFGLQVPLDEVEGLVEVVVEGSMEVEERKEVLVLKEDWVVVVKDPRVVLEKDWVVGLEVVLKEVVEDLEEVEEQGAVLIPEEDLVVGLEMVYKEEEEVLVAEAGWMKDLVVDLIEELVVE